MRKNAIGVIYLLSDLLEKGIDNLLEMGLECVQLQCWDETLLTRETADQVLKITDGKLRISSFWAGWSGPAIWNFTHGPETLGLVPEAYRAARMAQLIKAADFTSMLGATEMATHVGFIPENPNTAQFAGVYGAVLQVVKHCKELGINFNFETGQETPVTLMRMITDLNSDNVGINLDPANLIAYGKANPVDALDLFKGYVRGVHIKDAYYPTTFYELGKECVVGEGSVNYSVFLPKLLSQGYTGDLYIEREITGEQQIADIITAKKYITELMIEE